MKQLIFTCLLMFINFIYIHGQKAGGYHLFVDSTTSYQFLDEITVGTELGTKFKDYEWNSMSFMGDTGMKVSSCNSKKMKTIPLGFSFPYAGKSFSGLVINANGLIYLGQDSVSPGFSIPIKSNACENTNYTIYCSPSSSSIQVGSYKKSETDRSSITYGNILRSSENWFVIEYKNILIRHISGYPIKDTVTDTATFQIMLGASGNIRFHFDKLKFSGNDKYYKYEVGIKGETKKKGYTNFYDYAAVSSTSSWTNVIKYTQNSAYSIQNAISLYQEIAPPSGLMYTFEPPALCTKPGTPQSIEISRLTATSASVSFPNSEKEVKDGNIVLLGKKGCLLNLVDGREYLLDDSIGEVKILNANFSEAVLSLSNLEPACEYELITANFNEFCKNGPIYSDITRKAFKTLLEEPVSMEVTAQDTTSITIETQARNNYQVLICISALDNTSLVNIPSDVKLGDILNNGDEVIYIGDAGQFIYTNAKPGQGYYFNVYSVYKTESGFEYSTKFISAAGRTISYLPLFFDFNNFSTSSVQSGFLSLYKNINSTDVSAYRFSKPSNSIAKFEAQMNASQSGSNIDRHDSSDLILPPVILGQGKHRLVFQKAFLSPPKNFMSPPGKYQLTSSDSLLVQIGTSLREEDFQTIYVINNENYTDNTDEFSKNYVTINAYKGEKVYIRFVYHTRSKNYSRLTDFTVEEYLDCETPLNIRVPHDSIQHNHAYVDWTNIEAVGKPSSYNLQYLINDTWSEIISSSSKPVLLEKLPTGSILKVRVQANCGSDGNSFWSIPSASFRTKFVIPYFSDFSEIIEFDNLSRWKAFLMYSSVLSDKPIDILNGGDGITRKAQEVIIPWKAKNNNPAIAIPFKNTGYFVCSPEFYIEDSVSKKILQFDISINDDINKDILSEEIPDKTSVFILITDQAYIYDSSHIVAHFGYGSEYDLQNLDSLHVEIDISKYSGEIQVAFYTECSADVSLQRARAFFDNLSIDYLCKEATNLEAKKIKRTAVELSWESSGSTSILTYHVNGSSKIEDTIIIENAVKNYHLDGLEEGTNYIWYIENVCDNHVSSAKASNEFTTYVCDTVSNTRIVFNEKHSAILAWDGEGLAYKFRYRELGSNLWDTLMVNTDSIAISGLKAGTRYEYAIQSLCALDEEDKVSKWTQNKSFRTLFITCDKPSEFKVHDVLWNKVFFTWISEAKNIQMLFSKEDGSELFDFSFGSHDTCSVNDLSPNTSYKALIRAVCAEGDESEWTDTVHFTTLDIVPCLPPTNLSVELLSSSSAQLSWTPQSNHQAFHLCYREIQKKWDTVSFLYSPSHILRKLKTNVVYQWKVQGVCEKYLYSGWSPLEEFTCVSIEDIKPSDITVFGYSNQIHIMNPLAINIEKTEVYSVSGQLLFFSEIRAKDHLIIPMNKKESIYIVRVFSKHNVFTYKILVK